MSSLSSSWTVVRNTIHAKWKARWCAIHPVELAEDTWEYLFTGGKEIRASLFCELWDYLCITEEPVQGEMAFMMECIHVASLVLDDSPWMDNASTRRGKPTLHVRYSDKKALALAYDVMYMVYQIWTDHRPSSWTTMEWNAFLERTLERMIGGQWHDLERSGSLVELASLKTGVLFEFTCECVAIGTGTDRAYWRQWGNQLGVLFQWVDDWHDQEEDRQQQNRNAFNESYQETMQQYREGWQRIVQEIGPAWFRRPFGEFMHTYFTLPIPFSDRFPSSCHVDSLASFLASCRRSTPSCLSTSWELPDGCVPKGKLMTALMVLCHRLDVLNEKMNLWEMPEDQWADIVAEFIDDHSLAIP